MNFRTSGESVSSDEINPQEIENLHETSLAIDGMYCEACAYGVEAQIKELDGIVSADVDHKTASGVVRYDADKVSAEDIAKASTVYIATVSEDKRVS